MAKQEEGQMGGTSFPSDAEEAETFVLNMVKAIHSDDGIANALQENVNGSAPSFSIIGTLAAKILTILFTKVYKETQGEKVGAKFVIKVIRAAVLEISQIAEAAGHQVGEEDKRKAAKIAGDALDESMRSLYSGQAAQQEGQPQGPPQGQPQGMMQGPGGMTNG